MVKRKTRLLSVLPRGGILPPTRTTLLVLSLPFAAPLWPALGDPASPSLAQAGSPSSLKDPAADTDGDGIKNAKDKCPRKPETMNGYQDLDGCPDVDPNAKPPPPAPAAKGADTPSTGTPGTGTSSAGTPSTGTPSTETPSRAPESQAPAESPAAVPASGAPSTSDAAMLQALQAATEPIPAPLPSPGGQARNSNGFSNLFNPAISVNGLFLGTYTNAPSDEVSTGVAVQELEIQFLSQVDPYFGANLILALEGGEGIELEEGFLTLTPQPANLALKFGKLKVPFGRENPLHSHGLPFVDKSLVGSTLLGEEGLGEVGAELSYLIPLPFYSLLYGAVLNGDNETLFAAPEGTDLAYFGGMKNLLELSDDATLELGLSYAAGKNAEEQLTQVAGAHLVFKWRPARAAKSRSAVAVVEALYAHRPTLPDSEAPLPLDSAGAYAYLQWQLAPRYYVAGRFDYLGLPTDFSAATLKETLLFTFAPTEFSALRLQGSATQAPGSDTMAYEAFFQVNFTLGAHPAHAY